MLGAIALVMLVAVVFAVTLPLFYEVTLTVLAMAGWSSLRTNGRVLRIGYHVNALSDKAEYGVAAAVLLLITLPIYTHYSQLVPFFRALHEHQRGADVEMGDAAAAAAAEHETLTHILVFHLLPSVWINAGMLVNFFAAAVRGPGRPDGYLEGSWCKTCRIYRPPGSHHCSSCNTCILDMDHHCPFTAGCIGRRNIRFFFWFITFSLFACLYALWLTFHPFVHCRAIESAGDEAQHPEHLLCQSELGSKARLFYLAVAAAVVVSAFWVRREHRSFNMAPWSSPSLIPTKSSRFSWWP